MATSPFNDIASTDTRPHPYSIARSYSPSPIYDPPAVAPVPPPTLSCSAPLPVRITSANCTRPGKPFARLLTTRSLSCMGSSYIDDDHRYHMLEAHNTADVNEHDFSQSFFEKTNKVDRALNKKTLKRTYSIVESSLKSMRSWFASIGNHYTPPPMVEPLRNKQPYHYHKRSLRRAMSFHSGDSGEPSLDEHNIEIAKRRAGNLDTAIRAIESAPYMPVSPCNMSDQSSRPCPFAFDDIDSIGSGSTYSPTGSPAPTVHRGLLFTEYKEDRVERVPKEAPRGYVFGQPLAPSSDSDKPRASPRSPLHRPTPQVYPRVTCQTTARQDSLHKVVHRSPMRTNVPSSGHFPAPLSPPPLPNRNPRRTPSDSGHGPLIHATLDRPFRGGGQGKLGVSTPGPRTIVLKQPAAPPSSW